MEHISNLGEAIVNTISALWSGCSAELANNWFISFSLF